jgi:hypothetical protein
MRANLPNFNGHETKISVYLSQLPNNVNHINGIGPFLGSRPARAVYVRDRAEASRRRTCGVKGASGDGSWGI